MQKIVPNDNHKKMNPFKSIIYFILGGLITSIFCSFINYMTNRDRIEQTISVETNKKELPVKQNDAFKEGEIL